jgi:hypothetical protein
VPSARLKVTVDWDDVGELPIDPAAVPNEVQLRRLTPQDGRLIPYGQGGPEFVDLA